MFGKKTNEIWLIAGLGNPGLQYAETRHNAGFMAADRLAEKHNMAFNKRKFDAEYGEIIWAAAALFWQSRKHI